MPHRLASIALLLFSILCINTFPAAQEESTDIKVKVELTTIDVFALDKHGQPVPNLKKEDFELYEDGKKQEILSGSLLRSRVMFLQIY